MANRARVVGQECWFCGEIVQRIDKDHIRCGCGVRNTIRRGE